MLTTVQPFEYLSALTGVSVLNSEDKYGREQHRRIQHLQNACADESLFRNKTYRGRIQLKYYFSRKYNFSYCKVPKAGCSFWTQAFAILEGGITDSEHLFGMARTDIHSRLSKFGMSFDSEARKQSRTILVSRDPYSRLFSGFIDKIYLPLLNTAAINVVRNQRDLTENEVESANNITFQEFLQYILDKTSQGATLNRHWAPIVSLCNPCNVHAFAVVKQESFSADVEYALKKLRVADNQLETISDALHGHRVESTIPGIVKTVIGRPGRFKDRIELARRIWVSFQIQGFIKESIAFPVDIVDTDAKAKNASFLSDIILKTIKENPLTSAESRAQRQKALENAYADVSRKTIEGLTDVYKQDFVLFDYSLDPPSTH